MTDSSARTHGPPDPHGPGGQDSPAPPGGPQRTDAAPDGADTPGTPGQDPGPETQRVTRSNDDRDVPPVSHDPDRVQDEGERARQQHNAGTSDDEPSG